MQGEEPEQTVMRGFMHGLRALGYVEGFDGETHPVATPEEAAALLEELAQPGDRVLIKGSRSVGLERVLA